MNLPRSISYLLILIVVTGTCTFTFNTLVTRYLVHQAEEQLHYTSQTQRALHFYIQKIMHPEFFRARAAGEIPRDYYAPEILSSSFIVREMHGFFNQVRTESGDSEVYYKIATDNPRNPKNRADGEESRLIRYFNEHRDIKDFSEISSIDGKDYLVYVTPFLENNPACLRCHGERGGAPEGLQVRYPGGGGFNEKPGVIRAVESIRVPIGSAFSQAAIISSSLAAGLLSVLLLAYNNMWLRNRVQQRTADLEKEIAQKKHSEEELRGVNRSLEQSVWISQTLAEDARQARDALKESEESYRALVNAIPHGITVMDQEHRIVKINNTHAAWYGHPAEWYIGRHCYEVFEKRERICPHCPGVISMKTGEVMQFETEGIRDDGRRISVRLYTAPFRHTDGTSGFIEVAEDITERRRMEANARQMLRLADLGEMASGVAHEINNPVAGVINCAELLKSRLPTDNACQGIADRILREGNRIANIVRSLLSVAHPGQAEKELFSLRESLDSAMTLYEHKLEKAGIDVTIRMADDLPLFHGDRQKIEQVLLNLLGNAYYALNARFPGVSPEKRMDIKASCRERFGGQQICLEIYDQGTGIPKEIIGRIFDPFFTTKPAGSGTGLGLGLCYEIVKLHGGDIQVESEPGRYTRFTLVFPRQDV